jgi:hypothetical protein
MENKIPIPTDNIYKFYALFGLLIFIFSAGSLIYINRTTNDLAFQDILELDAVKQIPNPSPIDTAKKELLERRLTVAVSDRKSLSSAVGVLAAMGVILMYYGFKKWHQDIQPIQDEITKLQLEKLRHEVRQLKHTASHPGQAA